MDRLLLDFLRDDFVTDLLTNQLQLSDLFGLVFAPEGVEIRELSLAGIRRREFALPAFETLRTQGSDERLTPSSERTQVLRTQPKRGRLAWVDVLLDLDLAAKVALTGGAVDSITSKNLLTKLGPFNTIPELRAQLLVLYPESIVDAFFTRFRITSVEDFRKRPHLFLEIVSKEPPAFDPDDPAAGRRYRMSVCVQIQSDVQLGTALQSAKLCRSVMAGEAAFVDTNPEYDVKTPYGFLVLFPNASVTDETLPPLTAAQVKTRTAQLFQSEGMLAHFV